MMVVAAPVRLCVGCRTRRPAIELVRISVIDGVAAVGPGPGRGAWLCPDPRCLDEARKKRSIARALRTEIAPDQLDGIEQRLWEGP